MAAFDVAIVICTCGRGEMLERLLGTLWRQITSLTFEIIIVDNAPGSSEPLDGVRWIREDRRGLSYARNTGIRAAEASVVAFLDDDMEVPAIWLENLVRPIIRGEFDVVTGTTVPMKLETEAERLFEAYGGHGHAGERRGFDARWLAEKWFVLPLWEIGGLGNSAMRREVFDRAGYFDEALGAGTPAGSWEDLELIYRMLRSGCKILQEPGAAVLHVHRVGMSELSKQLCAYRRGEVCFCLLAVKRQGSAKALAHLLVWIPFWRAALLVKEVMRRVMGRRLFRFDVMWRESLAYVSGPTALMSTIRRQRDISRNRGE